MTRKEFCESLATGPPAPNDDGRTTIIGCNKALDLLVWNTCINEPEEKRGPCSDRVRNEEADKAEGASGGGAEKIPDSIKNPDHEKIVNCSDGPEKCLKDNPLIYWTKRLINFLAIGVGIVVTISIIIGGIQYSAAGSNPQAMAAAKKRITNALLALLAYMFLYGFVEYLIPGGFI